MTVIFLYGFTQTPDTEVVQDIQQSYVNANIVNFILVHYPNIQVNTVTNANEIGRNIAMALNSLFNAGYNQQLSHVLGFSLGAQIAGIVGRNVATQSQNRNRVQRITGLDPGQIQTVLLPVIGRLSPSDGVYVETVHTEGASFGDHLTNGHTSFWVNGGGPQPMCTSAIGTVAATCSHNFACRIWAESVRARAPIFPSRQCASWANFLSGACNGNAVGNMGHFTSTALRGNFHLATNNAAPFTRPL